MVSLEQFLEALLALKTKTASESLTPQAPNQTEFRFGYVCGVQAGLQLAEELINQQLSPEDPEDGDDSRSQKTRRGR